ncbi:hypothetical protein GGX14DRAFT_443711 [Mycena pura]|uniref:Uncharacterized protein n=1 Tax=Mycena pura TaxID=153505 RepID=A0AAD6VJY6_9AGAR|nr:hypothetical protein GGX14DRAFT_443711 [Mycena pura]
MLSGTNFKVLLSLACAAVTSAVPTTGTVFQITPGIGACGWTNTSMQAVGSVSNTTFNHFPGATKNPNKNPICNQWLRVTVPSKAVHGVQPAGNMTIEVQIVDFFKESPKAHANDVGIPVRMFSELANVKAGIIPNTTWEIFKEGDA